MNTQGQTFHESVGQIPLIGNPLCVRCGATTETGLPPLGGRPYCLQCSEIVKNWPYPGWLKLSLAGLLLLLFFALIYGRKYFSAGRDLYVGERLVEEHRYADAEKFLQRSVQIAPNSDKAVVLLAKAALLNGDVAVAQKAFQGHNHGKFEHAEDVEDVKAIWDRATRALMELQQAQKLSREEGKAAEAAELVRDAASLYPELPGIADGVQFYEEAAAFETKDYAKFLAIAQKQWDREPGSNTAGMLASALACEYAQSGDPAVRQQAEAMLEKAHQFAAAKQGDEKAYEEYAERIQYRLKSREIIDTQEYNRRFRHQAATAQ
jgi:hypothetical protein